MDVEDTLVLFIYAKNRHTNCFAIGIAVFLFAVPF